MTFLVAPADPRTNQPLSHGPQLRSATFKDALRDLRFLAPRHPQSFYVWRCYDPAVPFATWSRVSLTDTPARYLPAARIAAAPTLLLSRATLFAPSWHTPTLK